MGRAPTNPSDSLAASPPTISSPPPPPSRPPPLTLSGDSLSPYIKDLYLIFTRHSPLLQYFTLRSLNCSSHPPKSGISSFSELLQFQSKDQSICFATEYEVVSLKGGPPETDNQSLINVFRYSATNCSATIDNPSTVNFTFQNESTLNTGVNQQLLSISKNSPVTLTLHQRWGNIYRVRFTSARMG